MPDRRTSTRTPPTQECRCVEESLRRGIADAGCPIHGIAAFIRSLPDDTADESEGFVVEDGSDV